MNLQNLAITTGVVPGVLYVLAAAALAWLVWGRRRHLSRWVPAAAVVAGILCILVWLFSEQIWNLWGSPLPKRVYAYAGIGILALLLIVPKILDLRPVPARIAVVPAALVVVLASGSLINQNFDYYPTLGSVFGDPGVKVESLEQFKSQEGRDLVPKAKRSDSPTTLANWTPPEGMPNQGTVVSAFIPAPISHEASSAAFVYLPPAYLATPRANLPVLVLIHGVPGGTSDWIRNGRIGQFMDDYAASHKGLAPVVVMPDAGGKWASYPPLCMNTRQGQAGTYLSQDVPNWVKATFGAGTHSSSQWAVGGFSYGGTCAMQLAMNYPGVYPTFIDSSGENQPTIRQGHQVLLQQYFGGSAAEFRRQNALDVIKTRKYPFTAGIITVGTDDQFYGPQGTQVYQGMKRAGINVQLQDAPGGHAWPAWKYGVENNMDWLMTRLGVARQAAYPLASSAAVTG
jgi:enterochelin esterase-like enzyme